MKRLNLCKGHKQEENQSHFAEHNCDYCKLLKQYEEALIKLRALEDVKAILDDAPELNVNNYDHDQVCQLNTAMCEAWSLVHN